MGWIQPAARTITVSTGITGGKLTGKDTIPYTSGDFATACETVAPNSSSMTTRVLAAALTYKSGATTYYDIEEGAVGWETSSMRTAIRNDWNANRGTAPYLGEPGYYWRDPDTGASLTSPPPSARWITGSHLTFSADYNDPTLFPSITAESNTIRIRELDTYSTSFGTLPGSDWVPGATLSGLTELFSSAADTWAAGHTVSFDVPGSLWNGPALDTQSWVIRLVAHLDRIVTHTPPGALVGSVADTGGAVTVALNSLGQLPVTFQITYLPPAYRRITGPPLRQNRRDDGIRQYAKNSPTSEQASLRRIFGTYI